MKYQLAAVSTPASDTQQSICLFFPNARYLFGIPEATTRMCIQRKQTLKKLRGAFLSQATDGGLAGLTMSFADSSGSGTLNVAGPEGTLHRVAGMRYYNKRDQLKVNVLESLIGDRCEDALYSDEFVNVYGVTTHPIKSNESHSSSSPSPSRSQSPSHSKRNNMSYEESVEYKRKIVDEIFPGLLPPNGLDGSSEISTPKNGGDAVEDIPSRNDAKLSRRLARLPAPRHPRSDAAASYIVMGKPMRGKFNNEVAVQLQVPGPLRSKLTRKETVTFQLSDGSERTVTPEQVVAPDTPPTVFFIVNVPNKKHITTLVQSSAWERHRQTDKPHILVHNVGWGVLDSEEYVQWIKSWGPDTHHLVSSPEYTANNVSLPSSFLSLKRASVLSDAFKAPLYSLDAPRSLPETLTSQVKIEVLDKHHKAELNPPEAPSVQPTLMSGLPPGFDIRRETTEDELLKQGLSEKSWDNYSKACEAVKEEVCKLTPPERQAGDDVVVTTLGTGSALPSKYRNVSATLLQTPHGNILLDAGEGTWGQLARMFGERSRNTPPRDGDGDDREDAWDVLKNTKAIYLSHVHADHHIGLAKLLQLRSKAVGQENPVAIICNHLIRTYLLEQNELEYLGIGRKVKFVDVEALLYNQDVAVEKAGYRKLQADEAALNLAALRQSLNLKDVKTALVKHRCKCHAGIIESNEGWKVVYSGDTMPCENLVESGKDATLLIHEATMEDGLEETAEAKGHSTIGQAIQIGKEMNAKKVLLTHFSQRYSKLAQSSESQNGTMVIAHAFDLLSLRVGDLWKMSHYNSPLSFLLAQEVAGEETEDVIEEEPVEKQEKRSKKSRKAQNKEKRKPNSLFDTVHESNASDQQQSKKAKV
ncbi:hypothetical protein E3P81_00711 [Wallemia ichthyophaga]|nr:hypothetical protein E3P97_00712 [Wallemia ichthyophaga]TIA97460.1 hypothetical protein E3P96_03391 [Wallemia ichthyophaga]TIB35336.1 hypothetical protein E3P85_00568 [Wallemia ichthyophaga]TIB50017.1 hypothetical protein E3P82_00709 [Wallemia ichthyophaga]TIB53735.1 hypothetical protein E3P81_00711 [Wallemia ichthyophaga]